MKEFNLEQELENFTMDAETLASAFGFDISKAEITSSVDTRPKTIVFGEKEFFARFVFSGSHLSRVTLIPVIDVLKLFDFPSEEYQEAKQVFCDELLQKMYGSDYEVSKNGKTWETEKYKIGCYVVNDGHNKYTDGNITIAMK